jgi:hypothetical protein
MYRARFIVLTAILFVVSACAPTLGPPPPSPHTAAPSATVFRPGDFSWSAVPGRNRVEGRLTYQHGELAYTCRGAAVLLTPETPWTRRRMTILYNSPTAAALPTAEVRARTPSAPSEDYSAFVRRTTCQDDRFSFTGLPDGSWFVITVAKPTGRAGESVAIMRRIETRRGRTVNVQL